MVYTVDFKEVATIGLESSPVALAPCWTKSE